MEFKEDTLLTREEAAKICRLCVKTIDNFIRTRELPARRFGRRVRIARHDLEKFIRKDHLQVVERMAS
jgi:excisionase family DNA binding protein